MKHLLLFMSSILLFSCGTETSDKTSATTALPIQKEKNPKEENVFPEMVETTKAPVQSFVSDSAVAPIIDNILTHYSEVSYYTRLGRKLYFYVNDKPLTRDYRDYFSGSHKMGIVDSLNNIIVPIQFRKIGNPNSICTNFVETFTHNGTVGLYSLDGKTHTSTDFDVLYPTDIQNLIAVGKKGNDFFTISSNGEATKTTNKSVIPNYLTLTTKWGYDVNKATHLQIPNMSNYEPKYCVITPSYLYALKFVPEVNIEVIGGDLSHTEFGTAESHASINKSERNPNGFSSYITDFYEKGVGTRDDYITNESQLITVDDYNNVLDTAVLSTYYSESGVCQNFSYTFLNKSMIEVLQTASFDNYNYSVFDNYIYYKIDKKGNIEKLDSYRFFNFTKYIKITPDYFKGCFAKYIHGEERSQLSKDFPEEYPDYAPVYWVSDHLTIEDLDLMRNEIFAEYGYKFTSEKWQNYFSNYTWYEPKYDNVEEFLTEIDKYNIKIILEMKAKMQGNEDKYIHEERYIDWSVMAG